MSRPSMDVPVPWSIVWSQFRRPGRSITLTCANDLETQRLSLPPWRRTRDAGSTIGERHGDILEERLEGTLLGGESLEAAKKSRGAP